jgi:VIT1/CCC1 family predicted Fe2+/Mn2+ transporter/demethoxyubiquinone hydroxylase (CLK1/Coq7/Cat5 family)
LVGALGEPRVKVLDAPDLRANWEREARMAELYGRLAKVARNPTTRLQLERMAADEHRHARAWAGYLEARGVQVPATGPVAGATALSLLARVLGVGPVMSMAGLAEGRILRSYLGQMSELEDDAAKRILRELIPEESAHARGGESAGSVESWHSGGIESIRNVIYGVNDGLTATLGVLAGVGGATVDPHVVLVGGLAAMTASGVSMAGGAYLATKSQREIYEDQLAREAAEIEAMPELEREELKAIYRAKGLTEREAETIVSRITRDKSIWLETQAREELGLDAGQFENPVREAVVAGVSTLFGGFIPVVGYLLGRVIAGPRPFVALLITAAICVTCLFLMGSARSFFTGKNAVRSGLEMTLVGSVVAVITYGVGVAFRTA